jgi:class 3 adenylate cyclase/tetratricopeptide (TPR) repeat protein
VTEQNCERCGAPLPADALFCPRCGAPVAAITTEERKVVSVLFADVAGSTELSARLDPERFREVLGEFYSVVSAEIQSLRGRVEKFVGDAVMAVFGLPQAHDDDALRAVRAAFMIRDRIARLGETQGLPVPLRVRVGVNSGAVATGSGPADQFLVSGAPVNMAARLQQAADPGEVLVGETTWHLTRQAVEFDTPRRITAKGFDGEVMAWPVLALTGRSSRRTIPLVNRRRELALLTDTFERVRDARRPHLITVLGEPGIGKSRLVDEFVARLPEEANVLTGGANDFEEDATFAPLAEMIRRELGVERDAPAADMRRRLEEVVAGCCRPSESEKVVARLGLALGLGPEVRDRDPEKVPANDLAAGFDTYPENEGKERHRYRNGEVRAGFQSLIEGMARASPVVMVFEDMHLARPELLELIEHVVRDSRRQPVLVLVLARDGLLEVRPEWGGGLSDSVTLRLDPLSPEEAKDLAVAAGEDLDDATAERIARQAGGNPFFIVETTGMLMQEHPEHLVGASHSHLLPPTVQAVVASRIDHLPEEPRELLRRASVFARSTFSEWELSLIAEPKKELLDALEREEFLVRDPERPGVWRFRHEMLRDVAYESLPKRERLRLHSAVADGISAAEDADRYPQVVAHHLYQAARASLDLNPNDRAIADRAVKALTRAGDLARWAMDSRAAAELYGRALELAGPDDRWKIREARILSALGEARYWLGEFERARDSLRRALALAEDDAWTRTHACRFLGDIALNVDGDVEQATRLFDRALEGARELDEPYATARTLLMAGWAPYWRGDLESARGMFEEALEIARKNPEDDLWAEARALVSLSSVLSMVGGEREHQELGHEALDLGRKMDDPFTIGVAQETLGNSYRRMMQLDESLSAADEAVRIFRELGARWELASALGDRAIVHRLAGRLREAEADLKEALDLCRRIGERSLITWTAAELAHVWIQRGDRQAAASLLADPAIQPAATDTGSLAHLLRTEALLHLAEGNRNRALERARRSLELERNPSWRNAQAAVVWWVGRVFGPEATGGEGQLEQARRTLESAQWFHALSEPDRVLELVG